MRHARVVVSHHAPDRPAIQVAQGDTVTLGDHDRDWPQFVWITTADGQGGWVPAAVFDREYGAATALSDYDTRELDAGADAILLLHYQLADWWWAEDERGLKGWIPERALEMLDDDFGEDA
jgi:hypothetical protein